MIFCKTIHVIDSHAAAIEFGTVEAAGACHHRDFGYPCGPGHRLRRGERWLCDIGFYPECFFFYTSAVLDVPEIDRVPVDVAFGGALYALIDAVRFFRTSAGAEMRIKSIAIFPQGDNCEQERRLVWLDF